MGVIPTLKWMPTQMLQRMDGVVNGDRYVGNSGEAPYLQYSAFALLVMPRTAQGWPQWERCRAVFLVALKGDEMSLLRRLQRQRPQLVKKVAGFLCQFRGRVLHLQ